MIMIFFFFFFQAEDGIRDGTVTGVQTCALPICLRADFRLRSVGVQIRVSRGRTLKATTRWEHRVSKKLLSLRTSSSQSHFHQSRDMQQILETTRAPLATHSDSSFSAVPRLDRKS